MELDAPGAIADPVGLQANRAARERDRAGGQRRPRSCATGRPRSAGRAAPAAGRRAPSAVTSTSCQPISGSAGAARRRARRLGQELGAKADAEQRHAAARAARASRAFSSRSHGWRSSWSAFIAPPKHEHGVIGRAGRPGGSAPSARHASCRAGRRVPRRHRRIRRARRRAGGRLPERARAEPR